MISFPYADKLEIHRSRPERGVERSGMLDELEIMANSEDETWESGQCSSTMYCGHHDRYDFLNEAFAKFSHVNALQHDMCPSATKLESEIIAMTLAGSGARLQRHHGDHRDVATRFRRA